MLHMIRVKKENLESPFNKNKNTGLLPEVVMAWVVKNEKEGGGTFCYTLHPQCLQYLDQADFELVGRELVVMDQETYFGNKGDLSCSLK